MKPKERGDVDEMNEEIITVREAFNRCPPEITRPLKEKSIVCFNCKQNIAQIKVKEGMGMCPLCGAVLFDWGGDKMAEKEVIQKLRELFKKYSPEDALECLSYALWKVTFELLTSHADKLRQLDEKLTKTIETYNKTTLKIHERLTKLEQMHERLTKLECQK